MTTLKMEQFVKAPAAQAYHVFTNATGLREWMADGASCDPVVGGRFLLWWNSGYYTAGEYTALKPNQQVSFRWRGKDEPAYTQVNVILQEQDGGVQVTLEHDLGEASEEAAAGSKKEWANALENLVSVLETGVDLRVSRRPMLGFIISDFNPEIAAKMGVPVSEGIRIATVMEGMGMQKAGIQKDDVIVKIAEHPIINFPTLAEAMSMARAGDQIEVIYYRGAEEKHALVQLSGRPIPEFPWDPEQFALNLQTDNKNLMIDLEKLFEGTTEEEASHKPSPQDWSAKEILAHLIHGERDFHEYLNEIVSNQERISDGFGDNSPARIAATTAAYGTVAGLIDELKHNQAETIAYFSCLPPEFVTRKSSYWRLAYGLADGGFALHARSHFDQIKAAIASAH